MEGDVNSEKTLNCFEPTLVSNHQEGQASEYKRNLNFSLTSRTLDMPRVLLPSYPTLAFW